MWGPKAGRGESRAAQGQQSPKNPLTPLQGALAASLLHSQPNSMQTLCLTAKLKLLLHALNQKLLPHLPPPPEMPRKVISSA